MSDENPYAVVCAFGIQHIHELADNLDVELTNEEIISFLNFYEDAILESMNIAACDLISQYLPQWNSRALPEPQKRWISFTDYSPFYNGTYTVWRPGEEERKADWSNKGWSACKTGERLGLFTHWCPMPER